MEEETADESLLPDGCLKNKKGVEGVSRCSIDRGINNARSRYRVDVNFSLSIISRVISSGLRNSLHESRFHRRIFKCR